MIKAEQAARRYLCVGAMAGMLTVAIGAFGAHALKSLLSESMRSVYETAVYYQMFHTSVLLVVGLLLRFEAGFPDASMSARIPVQRALDRAGRFFTVGLILFCGSLYALAISGVKYLGIITPFGGLAFLLGWYFLFVAVANQPAPDTEK